MSRETHHRVNQTLVAISEVCGQPSRGLVEGLGRPLSVGEVQRLELLVLLGGVFEPGDVVSGGC